MSERAVSERVVGERIVCHAGPQKSCQLSAETATPATQSHVDITKRRRHKLPSATERGNQSQSSAASATPATQKSPTKKLCCVTKLPVKELEGVVCVKEFCVFSTSCVRKRVVLCVKELCVKELCVCEPPEKM